MTDINTSAPMPSDDELLAHIEAEGSDIMSIPTGNTIEGSAEFRAKILNAPRKLDFLAPEDREIVQKRLEAFPIPVRAQKESELVGAFVAEKVRALRVRQGPGPNANALTVERWMLAREADDLDRQQDAIIDDLAAVDRYDQQTGAPIFRYPVDSAKRKALEAKLHELNTASSNIRSGREGQERLAIARQRALADAKRKIEDQYVAEEAKRRAESNVLNERIERLAEGRAKRLRDPQF